MPQTQTPRSRKSRTPQMQKPKVKQLRKPLTIQLQKKQARKSRMPQMQTSRSRKSRTPQTQTPRPRKSRTPQMQLPKQLKMTLKMQKPMLLSRVRKHPDKKKASPSEKQARNRATGLPQKKKNYSVLIYRTNIQENRF